MTQQRVGRVVSRAAAAELITVVREAEGRRSLRELLQQQLAAQNTIAELEDITREVGDASLPHKQRLKALSRLAKAITACAAEHSLAAMRRLEQIRALGVVQAFCVGSDSDDLHVQGSGLAIFANVSLQGYTHLCIDAGVGALFVKLLCPPAAATQPAVLTFAANALNNLTSDSAAAAAFSVDERSRLMGGLKTLLKSKAASAAHLVAEEARSRLEAVHALSERERDKLRKAAKKKQSSAANCSPTQVRDS